MGGFSGVSLDDMEGSQGQAQPQGQPQAPQPSQAPPNASAAPVKAGLRHVLMQMLSGFSGGAGEAMRVSAGLPSNQEIAVQNAGIAHTNAQTQLAQAQAAQMANTIPVQLPNGALVHLPAKLATDIVKSQIGAKAKTDSATTQANGRMGAAGLKEGYRLNPDTGQPEAIPDEQLSPIQKQRISQSQALEGLNNARAEYEQAKNDPESPVFKLARAKLLAAQQNAQASLGLRREALDARLTAQAGKVTTGVQNRAALADNIETNLQDMQEIANRRPDLFGPASGRISQIKKAAGTSDPDILAWEQAKNNLAKSNMGMHGMRSKYGMEHDLENLSFINQPEGLAGTFSAIKNSADQFRNEPDALRAREAGKPGGSAKTGAGGLTIQRDANGRIIGVK